MPPAFILSLLLAASYTQPLITIDDAPSHKYHHDQMLTLLKQHHRKAIFFVMGAMLQDPKNRALLKRIVAEGHELGMHLYSHLSPCRPTRDLRGHYHAPLGSHGSLREARMTERAIRRALGRKVRMRYWRAPFGHYCRAVYTAMRRHGYRHMSWHVADIGGSAKLMLRITAKRQPSRTVLLFHYRTTMLRRVLTFPPK